METSIRRLGEFAARAEISDAARSVARHALEDTVGVMLAGAGEEGTEIMRAQAREDRPDGPCSILGTADQTSPSWAGLVNGYSAHALDFDDMCWVTMAHPSAPLVAAGLAAAETVDASSRRLLDGYVVGFEVGIVLGRVMNPGHYENGWHCTSTIGTLGAAATAARVMGLDRETSGRALAIAASEASGVKANFGTMVKPLQVGLAARNGILAAQLAQRGMTASDQAIDGPQGLLVAMRSSGLDLTDSLARLGVDWEIVDGGITVKLYPSCAATHPTIDTLLDLRREHGIDPATVEAIDIDVDPVTPTVLVYERPHTGLEGKFSLHFCAAAALAHGRVAIDTFEPDTVADPLIARLVERLTMRVDDRLGVDAPPLTQARVNLRLTDGRTFTHLVEGARGYPARPPSPDDRAAKFLGCATRAVSDADARVALSWLRESDTVGSGPVRDLTRLLHTASKRVDASERLIG